LIERFDEDGTRLDLRSQVASSSISPSTVPVAMEAGASDAGY
jgi:hypothetical protein